jgi:hypothetical protein
MTRADWAGYGLSSDEGRIVDAIAVLEATGRPTYLDDIAEETGAGRGRAVRAGGATAVPEEPGRASDSAVARLLGSVC